LSGRASSAGCVAGKGVCDASCNAWGPKYDPLPLPPCRLQQAFGHMDFTISCKEEMGHYVMQLLMQK
jgi:hypothetical protein